MIRTIGTLVALASVAQSQTNPVAAAAHQWRMSHEKAIIGEFFELLAIPNIASDRANIQRNAEAIADMMRKRGVTPQLLDVPGVNPVVFGELRTPGASRTILFYAHYDGQPLDPKEWLTPPFAPVLRSRSIEKDGQVIPLATADLPARPRVRVSMRAVGFRRQSTHHRDDDCARCHPRGWNAPSLEYQVRV